MGTQMTIWEMEYVKPNRPMNVLVACEESQRVCSAFRERGHNAYSCDIQSCSGGHPEWHIKGDVMKLIEPDVWLCSFEEDIEDEMLGTFETEDGKTHELPPKWDLIIAHPPCTYLSNAGARFLYPKGKLNYERYRKGLEGKILFMALYNAKCDKICVENPIPSSIFALPKYSQTVQPYEHGHPFKKKTCLWLKGLPPLQPTNVVEVRESTKVAGNWFNKGGKDRQKNRAKTFEGIAKAMAEQWG